MQYAATGCLNATFDASSEAQLATVFELSELNSTAQAVERDDILSVGGFSD